MDRGDDPLTHALRPPPDETPHQRARRIREEEEALRVSEEIDKELHRERADRKRHRPKIKILLLGPSGSGKSTTLKNFQLAFTPKALQAEAAKYTTLIYLNVVTTIHLLCDVLEAEDDVPALAELRERCARLQPVIDLEESLASCFNDNNSQPPYQHSSISERSRKAYEVTVNAGALWRLTRSSLRRMGSNENISRVRDRERARAVLANHMKGIEAITQHPAMQRLLAARNQRPEHIPGYFLNDLSRITAAGYTPTDDDILRTRLRTLGASETQFRIESGPEQGQSWVVIDIGGSRYQRAAWVPYFDDVNAIIFIAPIGDFDQFLTEDRSINCLKDSLDLWETIVSHRLLAKSEIILFLNKYDILSQKLEDGIQFSKYVTSYKDENNAKCVGRYLQKKFSALHKLRSPNSQRAIHCYFTSVTEKSTTVALITSLRITTIRSNLSQTMLL